MSALPDQSGVPESKHDAACLARRKDHLFLCTCGLSDEMVKAPRAPRRRQTEVDQARHERNLLKAELKGVRQELREAKAELKVLRGKKRRC